MRSRYQRRAWLAFVGFVLALLSASLALLAKWFGHECAALAAIAFLFGGMVLVLLAALFAVLDIK